MDWSCIIHRDQWLIRNTSKKSKASSSLFLWHCLVIVGCLRGIIARISDNLLNTCLTLVYLFDTCLFFFEDFSIFSTLFPAFLTFVYAFRAKSSIFLWKSQKNKKCLNWGREKNGEAASIPFCRIFQNKSIADKPRSQNLVKKNFLKGVG